MNAYNESRSLEPMKEKAWHSWLGVLMGDPYVLTGMLCVLFLVCFGYMCWHGEPHKRPMTEMEYAQNADTTNFDDVLRK